MLDLVSVAGDLRRMRTGMASLAQETTPRLAVALASWERAASMGAALAHRVKRAKTSWLVAEPLEALGSYPVGGSAPYRVVASDGSQAMPDRHDHVGCFLINVGLVRIDYRDASADLSSRPTLCWEPDEVYPLFGGARQEADGRVVGARRFAAECDALRTAVADGPALLLTDGTLILWWLEQDPDRLRALAPHDVKSKAFDALTRLWSVARSGGCDVVGYLSGPRGRDVVSMLKVVLCTEDPVDCDHCPYESGAKAWTAQLEIAGASLLPVPHKPCEEADPVTDATLFRSLLDAGERSARFRSAARIAQAYDAPVDFVYLNTGTEIARVEFPGWVTPGGLESLMAGVLDQCHKGFGYPVALAEAHEQAVVRAADRRAFNELLERAHLVRPSAKLARKRMGVL